MATINNYSDLQAAVARYMHRTDLATMIPDFIGLGESRLNRELRLTQMESFDTLTTSTSSRFVDLPARFSEPLNLTILLGNVQVKLVPVTTSLMAGIISATNAQPRYYTIGNQIELNSISDQPYTLTLHCIKNFDLAADNVNWLITNAHEIYLYAALMEGYIYVHDEKQAEKYSMLLNNAIDKLSQQDGRSRSVSRLVTEPGQFQTATAFNINRGY